MVCRLKKGFLLRIEDCFGGLMVLNSSCCVEAEERWVGYLYICTRKPGRPCLSCDETKEGCSVEVSDIRSCLRHPMRFYQIFVSSMCCFEHTGQLKVRTSCLPERETQISQARQRDLSPQRDILRPMVQLLRLDQTCSMLAMQSLGDRNMADTKARFDMVSYGRLSNPSPDHLGVHIHTRRIREANSSPSRRFHRDDA